MKTTNTKGSLHVVEPIARKTNLELRKENENYFAGLFNKRAAMGEKKVPKHYFMPAINRMITAGEEANAIRSIRRAFNQNPEIEFKQSFQGWWSKTAAEILKWEIIPMIHERINIRGIMDQKHRFF